MKLNIILTLDLGSSEGSFLQEEYEIAIHSVGFIIQYQGSLERRLQD